MGRHLGHGRRRHTSRPDRGQRRRPGGTDVTHFAERYLERPRHVEIQLLADTHGACVALGERECSIQRRHQKVLEESPSPAVDPTLRKEMSAAAVRFARAIGYAGAGTAEFMLERREFFFLELNARIQVEHPVTELVTGVDLVRAQLAIAQGEPLPPTTSLLQGHAVEVRLYAEDPRTFLPQAGRIEKLVLPESVRVDAGIEEGDAVPTRYDPLLVKLIAHGPTREDALDRLAAALDETGVDGVVTNLPFLRWLVAHPDVREGRTTTAFLTEHPPLSPWPVKRADEIWRRPWRLNLPPPRPHSPPDVDAAAQDAAAHHGESQLTAPMPGTVIKVLVEPGASVKSRQPLLILEAMKMETPLVAPYDAVVRSVNVEEGEGVNGGTVLIELEE